MMKAISAHSKSTGLIFRTFSARDTIPLRMYGEKQCLESYMSLLNEYGMHYRPWSRSKSEKKNPDLCP
jgi:hypothetical protein